MLTEVFLQRSRTKVLDQHPVRHLVAWVPTAALEELPRLASELVQQVLQGLDSGFWILPGQPAVLVAPVAVEVLAPKLTPRKLLTRPKISIVIATSVVPASCCPAPLARQCPDDVQAEREDH